MAAPDSEIIRPPLPIESDTQTPAVLPLADLRYLSPIAPI